MAHYPPSYLGHPPPLPTTPGMFGNHQDQIPPAQGAYRFGADNQRRDNGPPGAHPTDEFSFRMGEAAPSFPREADSYRPGPPQGNNANRRRRQLNGGHSRQGGPSNMNRYSYRPRPPPTADRPLLRFQRGSTPEQLEGMNDDRPAENRFLDMNDMSDSAEEEMDESEQDEYEPQSEVPVNTETAQNSLGTDQENPEFQKTSDINVSVVTDTATRPKWSNPEYYTALPPPSEVPRKKKDVVKLIRKARVAVEKDGKASLTQVAANDDFISFSFDDQRSEDSDRSHQIRGVGTRGAPSGPHMSSAPLARDSHASFPGDNYTSTENLESSHVPVGPRAQDIPGEHVNGKRKRGATPNDDKAPKKRRMGRVGFAKGAVLAEWLSRSDATPWAYISDQPTEHFGFRLHKEVCDFYEFVKPQKFEQVVREELLERLRSVIRNYQDLSTCELHCFGSFAAGLYLPNADMDLVVVSQEFMADDWPRACQKPREMHKLACHLEAVGIAAPGSLEVIPRSKVPLVKFVDRITGIRVDLSFENKTGLVANATFETWKAIYPAMPILVTVIKQFLMMRGLNEVVNGGLGGFSVTCLVTSVLQNLPRVQLGELIPEHHLGEMLLEFLDLYGNQIDIARTGIRMNPPGYFNKQELERKDNKPDRLAIIDPNKRENNISGGSSNVVLILSKFSEAHMEILRAMTRSNGPSLLERMLGGNYENFLEQRDHLRELYVSKWGEPVTGDVRNYMMHTAVDISNLSQNAEGQETMDHSEFEQQGPAVQSSVIPEYQQPRTSDALKSFGSTNDSDMAKAPSHIDQVGAFRASLSLSKHEPKKALSKAQQDLERASKRYTSLQTKGPSDPAMRTAKQKAMESIKVCRAKVFVLEHPNIAAVEKIPLAMTKEAIRTLLIKHREAAPNADSVTTPKTHTTQGSGKGKRSRSNTDSQQSKQFKIEHDLRRSKQFKIEHPEIRNVPTHLTKEERRALLDKYASNGNSKKQTKKRKASGQQPISVNSIQIGHRGGNSNDNPMVID